MENVPSPTDDNGRGTNGRFLPGNRIATGNPIARQAQQLRCALMEAVKPDDLTRIVARLIALAEAGDVQAAKLILDRVLGPPVPIDVEERISQLEEIARGTQ